MTSAVAEPVPGPQRPLAATPSRRAGSVRRTTTVDTHWPDFEAGSVTLDVRGRDLRTGVDRTAAVLDGIALVLEVDPADGRVRGVDGGPDRLQGLVGGTLRAGFGRHLATALPEDAARRTLAHAVLDDLNGAFLVSGYAPLRAGVYDIDPEVRKAHAVHQKDICIGWSASSDMYGLLTAEGRTAVPYGPVAPALDADDPLGWHPVAPMGPKAMRRRRQLDVWRDDDGTIGVQSHFRDSYAAEDHEMALHEYVVVASVGTDGRIASAVADPRTLPWRECPGAAASASRVVGLHLDELAARVRRELVGPTTCTHLSSTLRLLADVPVLAAALDGHR